MPRRRIPLFVKIGYTLFMCVLVPFYWVNYGPTNFLYFCDVALFLTLAALWSESRLLASMPAVGILLPQLLWLADFIGSIAGFPINDMTGYMFRESIPLFNRSLSLFHGWLPLLLLWTVARLGYDPRAFWLWTGLAVVLMVICYAFLPAPPAPPDNPNLPVNVNYVYGPVADKPQEWMPPIAYLLLMLVAQPLVLFLPVHLALQRLFGPRTSSAQPPTGPAKP